MTQFEHQGIFFEKNGITISNDETFKWKCQKAYNIRTKRKMEQHKLKPKNGAHKYCKNEKKKRIQKQQEIGRSQLKLPQERR